MVEEEQVKTLTVQIRKNEEGQSVLEVLYSCPIGKDKAACEDEATDMANLIRNALASPKGVLVMPKVIETSMDSEVMRSTSIKRKKGE